MAAQILFPVVKSQTLLPENEMVALGSQSFSCQSKMKCKEMGGLSSSG